MSRVCDVTGRKPMYGNNVSHAHNKSRRRFDINLQKKRFWLSDESLIWYTNKALPSINAHAAALALKLAIQNDLKSLYSNEENIFFADADIEFIFLLY